VSPTIVTGLASNCSLLISTSQIARLTVPTTGAWLRYLFYFLGAKVGFELGVVLYYLSHAPSFSYFPDRVLRFAWGWPGSQSIYAFGMPGMTHRHYLTRLISFLLFLGGAALKFELRASCLGRHS
jgi:hypothetical protein